MGWSTAAGAPTSSAMTSARRWNALARSFSSKNAWIPATAKPVAAYAASVMWIVCDSAAGPALAAVGSTVTALARGRPESGGGVLHALAVDDERSGGRPA